jgi:predicted phosphodiesterase/DNA-binding transcriptional ArsR family regulator
MGRSPRDIIDRYMDDKSLTTSEIARATGYSKRSVRRALSSLRNMQILSEPATIHQDSKEDAYLVAEVGRLAKVTQRQADQLRVLRKERRIDNRYESAVGAYVKELCRLVDKNIKQPIVINSEKVSDIIDGIDYPSDDERAEGIFQLSDLHLNELIDLPHNKYDFRVAAKRLEKFTLEAINYFYANGIGKVHIILCGDFINSDRRLEELLSMATNRTRATLLAVELLSCVITQLSGIFEVTVSYVTGNESRVSQEVTHADVAVSDNYDTMIFEILKMVYRKSFIEFIDPDRPDETIMKVKNKNILVTHGGSLPQTSLGNAVQKVKGKYASVGIVIDFMLFGHFHDCSISDLYARSSALCGANAYSDSKLNLAGRASQLIHIVTDDSVNSIKIDLQNTEGYDGYDIDSELEAYNAKSLTKVIRRKTI